MATKKEAVASKRNKRGGCFVLERPKGAALTAVGTSIVSQGQEQQNNPESSVWAGRGAAIRWVRVRQRGALRWGGYQMGRLPDSGRSAFNAIASTLVGAGFG